MAGLSDWLVRQISKGKEKEGFCLIECKVGIVARLSYGKEKESFRVKWLEGVDLKQGKCG